MRDILKEKRLPMDACILSPADHPILLDEMDKRKSKLEQKIKLSNKKGSLGSDDCDLTRTAASKSVKQPTWYNAMRATYIKHGVDWVEPAPGTHVSHHVGTQSLSPVRERTNLWYQSLCSREKFILNLIEKVFPRNGQEMRAFVISRSPERSAKDRPTPGLWPCTMPRTCVWIEFLERVQTGTEKLMTQGLFPDEYESGRLNQTNLADLAGNGVGIPVVEVINAAITEEFLDILPVVLRSRPR
jgi:hypothetical protein